MAPPVVVLLMARIYLTLAWLILTPCLGIYKFYAVDVLTLADKPGFPILIDGHFADNDNSRYEFRVEIITLS